LRRFKKWSISSSFELVLKLKGNGIMRDNSAVTLKNKTGKMYLIGIIAFSGLIIGITFIKFLFSV